MLGNTSNEPKDPPMYTEQIRALLAQHARLLVDVNTLGEESDLYQAGLTSLSTVNLMLALEEHFDVEFLDRMLGRKTFGTIRNLNEAITELRGDVAPAQYVAPAQAGAQLPSAQYVAPAEAGAQSAQAGMQP